MKCLHNWFNLPPFTYSKSATQDGFGCCCSHKPLVTNRQCCASLDETMDAYLLVSSQHLVTFEKEHILELTLGKLVFLMKLLFFHLPYCWFPGCVMDKMSYLYCKWLDTESYHSIYWTNYNFNFCEQELLPLHLSKIWFSSLGYFLWSLKYTASVMFYVIFFPQILSSPAVPLSSCCFCCRNWLSSSATFWRCVSDNCFMCFSILSCWFSKNCLSCNTTNRTH